MFDRGRTGTMTVWFNFDDFDRPFFISHCQIECHDMTQSCAQDGVLCVEEVSICRTGVACHMEAIEVADFTARLNVAIAANRRDATFDVFAVFLDT